LIGDYNSLEGGMAWEDRPVEGSTGYGSSTDLRALYYALSNGSSAEIKKNAAYPFRSESADIVPIAHKKINMNLSSGVKQIETTQTQKASTKGNNLGYYVGSDIKLYIQNKVDYSKFYYPGDSAYSHELPYQNGSIKYNAPSQDIIDYLNEVKTNKDGSSYMNGNYLLRMSGRSQINFQNEDGLYAVENAQVGSWTGNLLVPNRVIWVAPIKAGTMKFVLFNPESKSMGFRLYKLIRSTPKDYSSYFSNGTYDIEFNDTLLSGKAYYFEKEISLDDINAGVEYALSAGDGYNPYIAYMDIGVDGSSLASTGTIASVDFVYEDSNEINGYSKITETNLSGVGFKLEGEATSDFLLFIFRSKDNGVQYATNGSGIVVSTFGNSATRKNSKEDFN
jgi:hypothetical protein